MNPDELESALRARLRAALEPTAPGPAAQQRVMRALAAETARTGGRPRVPFAGRLRATLVAVVALLAFGGALGGSLLALHERAAGGGAQTGGTTPLQPTTSPSDSTAVSPTTSPTPSPTTNAVAGPPPCDGGILIAHLADEMGAAGTQGADIVLHNNGSVACTMQGYTNIQGIAGAQVVQLGVTHSAGGTMLNNNNGKLPAVSLVTLQPGADAYVAIEHSDVTTGPTQCPSFTALLVTPPQGHDAVRVNSSGSILLCGGHGASIWIDEAPVSTTAYFKQ
jgi:Protein of unknown function (DUF4232)